MDLKQKRRAARAVAEARRTARPRTGVARAVRPVGSPPAPASLVGRVVSVRSHHHVPPG